MGVLRVKNLKKMGGSSSESGLRTYSRATKSSAMLFTALLTIIALQTDRNAPA